MSTMADINNPSIFVEACRRGEVQEVKKLMAEGVDVNCVNNSGGTGLMMAMPKSYLYGGRTEVVKILLACAEINTDIIRPSPRETALSIAIASGNSEAARNILSRNEIKLDFTDEQGRTYLYQACYVKNAEYVKLVLAHPRCTTNIVTKENSKGKTAEMFASTMGYNECAGLIRDYLVKSGLDTSSSISVTSLGSAKSVGRVIRAPQNETLSLSQLNAEIKKMEDIEKSVIETSKLRERYFCLSRRQMKTEIAHLEQQVTELRRRTAFDLKEIQKKKESLNALKSEVTASNQHLATAHSQSLLPECPVCYEKMRPPKQIYTCGNGHLICSACKPKVKGNTCVYRCMSVYQGRANGVEQMVNQILGIE